MPPINQQRSLCALSSYSTQLACAAYPSPLYITIASSVRSINTGQTLGRASSGCTPAVALVQPLPKAPPQHNALSEARRCSTDARPQVLGVQH
jgi:hypothetical protein